MPAREGDTACAREAMYRQSSLGIDRKTASRDRRNIFDISSISPFLGDSLASRRLPTAARDFCHIRRAA